MARLSDPRQLAHSIPMQRAIRGAHASSVHRVASCRTKMRSARCRTQHARCVRYPYFYRCRLVATLSWVLIIVARAQGPAPSPLISAPSPPEHIPAVAPRPSPAPELSKADFETFLDALIPSQLRNRSIAGTVMSVVKDG